MENKEINFSSEKFKGQKISILCANCGCSTNHEIIHSTEKDLKTTEYHYPNGIAEESYAIYETESWQILKCLGCECLSFRKEFENSEDMDPDGQHSTYVEIFPRRSSHIKRITFQDWSVPYHVKSLYEETCEAISSRQNVLAGIGIRCLVESVCKEKGAKKQNLFENINELVKLGVLTQNSADILQKLRVMGNESAHEVKSHSQEKLLISMEIVEHLLKEVYIFPNQTAQALS